METTMEAGVKEDVYVFEEPEEVEVTPNLPSTTAKWGKFKETMMVNKNQYFDSKILKQNILRSNNPNGHCKGEDLAKSSNFFQDLQGVQKQNQDYFVGNEDLVQFESSSVESQIPQLAQITTNDSNLYSGAASELITQDDVTSKSRQLLKKKNKSQKGKSKQVRGLTINYHGHSPETIIYDKRTLLMTELPPGVKLMCKLKRRRELMSFIAPEYDFYLQSGLKHMLSAQKQVMSHNKVFKLSMDAGEYSAGGLICTMTSNALHNHYLIKGANPEKKMPYQLVHGEISYHKLKKNGQPRDMDVTIPYKANIGVRPNHLKTFNFEDVSAQYKLVLLGKKGNLSGSYLIESEKNFELVDDEQDFCYLRLKKDSDNIFSVEIQHPLTPLQAFAIVLTRFDAQIK